jgi:hypothetical protein
MAETELEKRLVNATALFDREATALLKVEFTSRYNQKDRMRLLNLVTWSRRYQVPYRLIFQVLVNYWRQKFSAHTVPGRLGVKPATLVGRASRDIIERFVAQTYPDDENEAIWRETASRRVIAMMHNKDNADSPGIGLTDDPAKLVAAYKRHIAKRQDSAKHIAHRMARRHFRNNPFV